MNDAGSMGCGPIGATMGSALLRPCGNLGRGPRSMQDRLEAISGSKTARDLLIDR
jgi:hypothetical protein